MTVLPSAMLGLLLAGAAPPSADVAAAIQGHTAAFLEAYAAGNSDWILRHVDPDEVDVYGSDVAEVVDGISELRTLLADDQRLWGGAARFGTMQNVSVRTSGELATIFFDVPFQVGERPSVTVRFAMTWRKSTETWFLTQSSNVVPTTGSSAAELLRQTRN